MKTIILIPLGLCLLLCISAEKSSHKHAGKLLKSGHELKAISSKREVDTVAADIKSPLPAPEETPAVAAKKRTNHQEGGVRKHHRHGKNKKGGSASQQHQQEQQQQQQHQHQHQHEKQNGRSRKSHSKSKVNNNNGPTKVISKHGRKHGRGKQAQ